VDFVVCRVPFKENMNASGQSQLVQDLTSGLASDRSSSACRWR
jgi:hypothetical protein